MDTTDYRYLSIDYNSELNEVVVWASPTVLRYMANLLLNLAEKQTKGAHYQFDEVLGYLEGNVKSLVFTTFIPDENAHAEN